MGYNWEAARCRQRGAKAYRGRLVDSNSRWRWIGVEPEHLGRLSSAPNFTSANAIRSSSRIRRNLEPVIFFRSSTRLRVCVYSTPRTASRFGTETLDSKRVFPGLEIPTALDDSPKHIHARLLLGPPSRNAAVSESKSAANSLQSKPAEHRLWTPHWSAGIEVKQSYRTAAVNVASGWASGRRPARTGEQKPALSGPRSRLPTASRR
jgi:hypothetical protein